jgi:hypothetical protein
MSNRINLNPRLTQLIQAAIDAPDLRNGSETITDFHVYIHSDAAEISICDDDGNLLAQQQLEEWDGGMDCNAIHSVLRELRQSLQQLDKQHAFDALPIFRPFSFVYEDTEAEDTEELFLVDREAIMLSEELLEGLDEELDDFLKHLIND